MTVLDEIFEVIVKKGEKTIAIDHYDTFPEDEQILDCIKKFSGDYATVQKIYRPGFVPFSEEPVFLNASDIDMSNTVFMTLSNPLYKGEDVNIMDFSFEYPKEKIHIISMIKLAVRCGLKIRYHSNSEEAAEWVTNYYEYYKS